MQVVAYIILGLYSLKYLGICSKISRESDTSGDLFTSANSKNLHDETEIYLQTSYLKGLKGMSPKLIPDDFVRPLPLISDHFLADASRNVSAVEKSKLLRKRYISMRGFTHETKMQLLQLHNIYRSNVTPTAGNMAYMEWDDELARLAQIWSNGCDFKHGMPKNNYPFSIGQNLYIGPDHTGYTALFLWFEEYQYYDMLKDKCLPGEQCGHYIQMAWATSNKLGCGMSECDRGYLVTCHYSPGPVRNVQMYRIAKPCSQCPSTTGSLCLYNLCLTWEQCRNHPFECQTARCSLECLNGGSLDKERCVCKCADGWDSPDCSYVCTDKHEYCGKSPGWPNNHSCSLKGVSEVHCRKMCGMCQTARCSLECLNGGSLDKETCLCKCADGCDLPDCSCKGVISGSSYLIPYFSSWLIVLILIYQMMERFLN